MAEIKQLKYMYSKDYREVFEDIATLMFCTELGLDKGVNRRINQRAIESDPVFIDGKWYAYQAKYYDASTKLSEHKQDLIKCIERAASRNVTDLFLYINKNLPDTVPDTGEEAGYIREIEDVASHHSVILQWCTLSMIETSLDMPKYAHIKNLFFEKNIKEYYDYVVNLYEKPNTGNMLLGEESLADLYMQPSYFKSESEIGDVEQLLEEFCSKGKSGVLWIVGEPGHGKTSMCRKAVADYRKMRRYLQANGVFWFRLNPQGIPGMVNPKMLTLEKVFSWGRITGNRSNMIEPGDIEGSLVFLDGFDELKSSLEELGISNNQFYEQVNQMAQEYQLHIVVTSRTRALEQEEFYTEPQFKGGEVEIICNLSDGGELKNKVILLSPLTKEKQTAWINELISLRENKGIDTSDLRNYKHIFKKLQENEDIAGLLKVPILLRMIIQNCFEPLSGNRVELYRELFDKTLLRQGLGDQREQLHSIYQEIAFRIFVYDDDCTELNKKELKDINYNNAYLYQYYLHTPEVESGQDKADIYGITFLHRSFYQYFLSEFFYEKLKSVTDCQGGESFLKYLWPRHMEPDVLYNLYLRAKNEDIDHMQIFKAIDETDAFLSEYKNSSGSKESIGNYDKANNVFWNAVSACNNIFQVKSSQKKMELTGRVIELMSKYSCSGMSLRCSYLSDADLSRADLSGADLRGAVLCGTKLSGARLREADLREADLREADLSKADLREVDLRKVDLRGANLNGADLRETVLNGSNLRRADLRGADLGEVDLSEAYLPKADLSGAGLRGADLREADLSGAVLSEAGLREADLREADLSGAILREADLSEADLSGADLTKAYICEANLSGANLCDADLSGANLSGAKLREANLCDANLSEANLRETNLREADLSRADLSRADFISADLSRADLGGAYLSGAYLSIADLSRADLSRANLSGANLSKAKLSGADLHEAYLSGANLPGAKLSKAKLSGADLSEAKLSGANLPGAKLNGANLSEADLSGADLSEADLSEADLSRANLSGANLSGAYLSGANLPGAKLSRANLSGADLSEAKLSGANLPGAKLSGANLSEADLSGADLNEADLSEADLSGADLSGAKLSGADLSEVILDGAKLQENKS